MIFYFSPPSSLSHTALKTLFFRYLWQPYPDTLISPHSAQAFRNNALHFLKKLHKTDESASEAIFVYIPSSLPLVNQRWRIAGVFRGAKSFELSPAAHPFPTDSVTVVVSEVSHGIVRVGDKTQIGLYLSCESPIHYSQQERIFFGKVDIYLTLNEVKMISESRIFLSFDAYLLLTDLY